MQVKQFQPYDRHSLNRWLKQRGSNADSAFSHTAGYIVKGVACMFISELPGGLCMIEGMCTNPHASAKTRNAALLHLYNTVLSLPYKRYMGYSVDAGSIARATALGFKIQPHTLLTLTKE